MCTPLGHSKGRHSVSHTLGYLNKLVMASISLSYQPRILTPGLNGLTCMMLKWAVLVSGPCGAGSGRQPPPQQVEGCRAL